MAERLTLSLAQFDPTVGDLAGNLDQAVAAHEAAAREGAALLALPEMFLTGYQPQDLVLKPAFQRDVARALDRLAAACAKGPALGIGAPWPVAGRLHNAFHILEGGEVRARILKHHLPNTEVFDERRVFDEGPISGPVRIGPARIGFPICEDAWYPDVAETLAETGAEILLVPNGSPYYRGKHETRMTLMVARVVETGLPLVYLNMVGGQDDQLFDGASFVLNPGGRLAVQMPAFDTRLFHARFRRDGAGWQAEPGERDILPEAWELDYRAMVEGVRGYWRKTGFAKALLGLSGGIDSALTAAIAADALGADNLRCIMLPSRHTAPESLEDAAAVARALGCRLDEIAIEGPRRAIENALAPLFAGIARDITEENIQSRLRGLLLMAVSNKFGEMLITTGNKSEIATGYATIYGDMNGGYNPLKDLYKTRVFETCRWRNANHRPWMRGPAGPVIPERVIVKPPSAELRDNQKDQDSLPPYEVLDAILDGLVERDLGIADLVAEGHEAETVQKVARLLALSEYKRHQSAPGAKLTKRAFWLDRRYPIANRWRDRSSGSE